NADVLARVARAGARRGSSGPARVRAYGPGAGAGGPIPYAYVRARTPYARVRGAGIRVRTRVRTRVGKRNHMVTRHQGSRGPTLGSRNHAKGLLGLHRGWEWEEQFRHGSHVITMVYALAPCLQ